MNRRALLALLAAPALAQLPDFSCPMHPEVHTKGPGTCPKCGMSLEARIWEPVEFPMTLRINPPNAPAGRLLSLTFGVTDPVTGKPVREFEVVHEKYIHLFVVSSDLNYFSHEHPVKSADGLFRHRTVLPHPGIYKLLADFYPKHATPQLIERVVATAGYTGSLRDSVTVPAPDVAPKKGENVTVEMTMDPPRPVPGIKTMIFFRIRPAEALQLWLGSWAHAFMASNDLVDMAHMHPDDFQPSGENGALMQFNVFFPRPATYRFWLQVQRQGKVSTLAFTIPVSPLE